MNNKYVITLAAAVAAVVFSGPAQAEEPATGEAPVATPVTTAETPKLSRAEAMKARLEARTVAKAKMDAAVAQAEKKRDTLLKKASKITNKSKRLAAVAAARNAYLQTARKARSEYLAAVNAAREQYEAATGTGAAVA